MVFSAVRQYELAEMAGAGRTEDPAAESGRNQPRQIARVIEMRVSQDDRVDRRRFYLKLRPIPLAERLQSLKETAIHQHARAVVLQQVLRSGDRSGRTQKREPQHQLTIRSGRGQRAKGSSCMPV
jgi:hypothetical protein